MGTFGANGYLLAGAEYWPYVGASRNDFSTSYSALDGPDQNAQWCYMVSPKIPSIERNGTRVPTTVKKVKFTIKAYESAWGKPAEAVGMFEYRTFICSLADNKQQLQQSRPRPQKHGLKHLF